MFLLRKNKKKNRTTFAMEFWYKNWDKHNAEQKSKG